jgi:hypothetical protein
MAEEGGGVLVVEDIAFRESCAAAVLKVNIDSRPPGYRVRPQICCLKHVPCKPYDRKSQSAKFPIAGLFLCYSENYRTIQNLFHLR